MKRVIIASDFHLKFVETEDDKKRRKRAIAFIESLKGNTELLILGGDIFDLWFAWDKVIIRGYFSFLCALKQLRDSGCRIVFVAGNHDFCFEGFLADEIGLEIFSDNFTDKIQNKNILVNHGDLYTANDLRYKLFRSFTRNKIVMNCFKLIHPAWVLSFGILLSRSSRDRKVPKKLKIAKEQGLENFACSQFDKFDLVILGHSHNPKIVEYKNGTYANCGDWIIYNSYLELIAGKPELKYFGK